MTFLPCKTRLLGGVLAAISVLLHSAPSQAQSANRWLEVERTRGRVQIESSQSRSARVGDRLDQVGHRLTTSNRSSSVLAIDSSIGRVQVAQNTQLAIAELGILPDGARVTVLDITRGQARLQARRFTNPNSRLEVHGPTGIAAVRGTDFGVSVTGDGGMAIATESGLVEVAAESQSVQVRPGQVSTIIEGEPPTEPRLLDRQLALGRLRQRRSGSEVAISAVVDPANLVWINGEEARISRDGLLAIDISPLYSYIRLTVQNPLGDTRNYTIWVDDD